MLSRARLPYFLTGGWASNSSEDPAILIQNTANGVNFSGIDMVQQTIYTRPNLPSILSNPEPTLELKTALYVPPEIHRPQQ